MNLSPLNKTVVVEIDKPIDTLPSGIVLPQTAMDKQRKGRVVAVDRSCSEAVKEGLHVLFPAYVGNEYEVDGKEYIILKETELLGVLND